MSWRYLLPLLLLLAGGGSVGLRGTEAACGDSSTDQVPHTVGKGQLSVWECRDPVNTIWNTMDRVHISQCDNGQLEDGVSCGTITVSAEREQLLQQCPPEGPTAPPLHSTMKGNFTGVAMYYECDGDKVWISGRPGRFSQCFEGQWSSIYDVCDHDCTLPRDCVEVNKLGLTDDGNYYVVPTGSPGGALKEVNCAGGINRPGGTGWLQAMVAVAGGTPDDVEGGFGSVSSGPYFVGIEHLSALTWNDTAERPLVFVFVVEPDMHATYYGVVINDTHPYKLISVGKYHGNAGDAFRGNVGQDFMLTNGDWWWNNDSSVPSSKVSSAGVEWGAQQVQKIILYVRPEDYDRETACPPQIEFDSAWTHTEMNFPVFRDQDIVITYSCIGEFFMEGNGTTIAQKTTKGNATCVDSNGSLVWDNHFLLPCKLTCPENYIGVLENGTCIRFSDDEATHGIASASLKCHQEQASLAELMNYRNHTNVLPAQYYYTAHVRNDTSFEPQVDKSKFPCDPEEPCEAEKDLGCLAVAADDTWSPRVRSQNCLHNKTRYICMRPAYCPYGYSNFAGLCYKVVPSSEYSENPVTSSNHLKALELCAKEGASLAYPESMDELHHIEYLVRVKEKGESNYKDPLETDKRVIIGLNKWDNWTGGGVYSPDSEVIALAELTTLPYRFRHLTVAANHSDDFTLTPAPESESTDPVHYAVCQMYGLTGCLNELPKPTVNMTLIWPDNSTFVGTKAFYNCYPGYFSVYENDIKETQEWVCKGPLGGWFSTSYKSRQLIDCVVLEVCNETSLGKVSPYLINETSSNYLQLNGTINFTCPANMSTSSGETLQNVTCSKNNATVAEYSYYPSSVSVCDVCTGEPQGENATTDWKGTTVYTVKDTVTATCKDNHFLDLVNNTQTLTCSYTGWTNATPCYEGCGDNPPSPGANMVRDNFTSNAIGAELSYNCTDGLSIPETFPDMKDTIVLTCQDHVWMPNDTQLECAKVCVDNPPAAGPDVPEPRASSTWDNSSRKEGTLVQLTCPDGYVFADLNSTINVTCKNDGNWTYINTDILICRIRAITDPLQPDGSDYSGPPPPYWQGDVLNYTCPGDMMSPSGTNTTSITFNGTEWVYEDPEFKCLNVCSSSPTIPDPPANTTWDGWSRFVGTQVELSCPEGYVFADLTSSINVTCEDVSRNWTSVNSSILICRILAPTDPTVPPGSEYDGPPPPFWQGDILNYTCPGDTMSPAGTNVTSITFNGTEWVYKDPNFKCLNVCLGDPPTPHPPGNTTWNGRSRTVNTTVELSCPDGYVFTNFNSSINLTCEDDFRNWTYVNTSLLICRILASIDPPRPPGSEYSGPMPPYWQGDILSYECPENTMSRAGTNTTSVTFNGTEWVLDDYDFQCLNVCGSPPPAYDRITYNLSAAPVTGTLASYVCLGGFLVEDISILGDENITTLSDDEKILNITCRDSGWSLNEMPACKMCATNPPPPDIGVRMLYEGVAEWGAVASYTCASLFIDGTSTVNVTCVEGNWTLTTLPYCTETTTPAPNGVLYPPLPDIEVQYSETATYYWPIIPNNMTLQSQSGELVSVPGPFGFGNGFQVDATKEQCQVHSGYNLDFDDCSANPANCAKGFSIAIWVRLNPPDQGVWTEQEYSEDNLKTILSTGGDKSGHPGVRIAMHSLWLTALVSTGEKYWFVLVAGPAHYEEWMNIALRWDPKDADEMGLLELFVNGERVGHTMYSEVSGSSLLPLDPPEMMVGCHRDRDDRTYRDHITASFDELASWTKKVNDSLVFMGGFAATFADDDPDNFAEKVEDADMSDPQTAATIYDGFKSMTHEDPAGTDDAVPTQSASQVSTQGTEASPTDAAPSSTMMPDTKSMKKFETLVETVNSLTDLSKAPKKIDPDLVPRILGLFDPISNLLGETNVEKMKVLQSKKDIPGSSKIMEDATHWTRSIMQEVIYENSTKHLMYHKVNKNKLVVTHKWNVSEWDSSDEPYITSPDYKELGHPKGWNHPFDRAAVSINVVDTDKCAGRPINVVVISSRTYHLTAHSKVNEARMIPSKYYAVDSHTITVDVSCDPEYDEFGLIDEEVPACTPTPKTLYENPIRFKLRHIDGTTNTRRLLFHEEDVEKRIERRYCAWWNTELGDFGVWDSSGCYMIHTTETYTKCGCTHLGTFAILAKKTDPRIVPVEDTWLTVLRYVGYCLSFVFLIIYIIVVLLSSDLKDMFHMMGVNLSVAVLLGAVFMLVSDIHSVRDHRHTCTAIGTLIHYFYQSAGAWVCTLGAASFDAMTSGVIGGRLRAYIPISWGLPLISVGLTYLLFLMDLGEDPRCFIAWLNPAKYVFFGFQLFFVLVSFGCAIVVLTNMSTPALRKDNLIDDYGSFCWGAAIVMLFFDITWFFGFFCYVRLGFTDPDFYPIFQVLNSWTGLIIFLFIGLYSRRFKMVLAGQAKARRQLLVGYAFGNPNKNTEDAAGLGSPHDQRSNNSSPSASGRSSPLTLENDRPQTSASDFPSRPPSRGQVAGRPGSRPYSANL